MGDERRETAESGERTAEDKEEAEEREENVETVDALSSSSLSSPLPSSDTADTLPAPPLVDVHNTDRAFRGSWKYSEAGCAERALSEGMYGGLEDRDEKEPEEDSSGEGLASVVLAMDAREGDGHGEGKADWRERERNGRVEGDEVVVSAALISHAGDEVDIISAEPPRMCTRYRRIVIGVERMLRDSVLTDGLQAASGRAVRINEEDLFPVQISKPKKSSTSRTVVGLLRVRRPHDERPTRDYRAERVGQIDKDECVRWQMMKVSNCCNRCEAGRQSVRRMDAMPRRRGSKSN